ncbi:MAG: NAD-dependent epimerase/dehydratase family protein [Planctomycetota bacterium]
MEKRAIVTGGAGFIGSHLVRRLAAEGYPTCVIDSFDDYYDPVVKRANIAGTKALFKEVSVAEGDIRDVGFLEKTFNDFRPDLVIHLAARPGVRASIENPLLYSDVNVMGTQLILECCRKSGIRKFIFGSSSSVYGASSKVPFSEEDPCDKPVSPYAATKRAAEMICTAYSSLFDIEITCLRFFSVYGPMQRPEMAVYKFADLITRGKQLPMYGNGGSSRDYTYVDDIVDGIIAALENMGGFRVYNLGNSKTVRLADLIRIIADALGMESKIEQLPDQPGDVPTTYADITRSADELSYSPRTSIEDGVTKFIEWFRYRY